MAQMVKNLPAMWETQVWSLGWQDPLEKEMATHSSTLTWKIPWREEPGGLQSTGSKRVRHDWATSLSFSHPYVTTGKTIALTIWTFVGKVMSLLFNMLSRFVIGFLPRSMRLWLQSLSTVILEAKKIKSVTVPLFPHLFAMKWWDWMPWSSFFKCWILSQLFHCPLSPSSRGSLVPLPFLTLGWCHLHVWGYW